MVNCDVGNTASIVGVWVTPTSVGKLKLPTTGVSVIVGVHVGVNVAVGSWVAEAFGVGVAACGVHVLLGVNEGGSVAIIINAGSVGAGRGFSDDCGFASSRTVNAHAEIVNRRNIAVTRSA